MQGKSTAYPSYGLRLLFDYADRSGLDILRMRLREAQDFQLHLTTMPGNGRSVRFSKRSVLCTIGAVSSFYESLKRGHMCHANPFRDINRVKEPQRIPRYILSEHDMNVFLTHLGGFWKAETLIERRRLYRLHVAAEFLYATGMRIGEAITLTVDDIDFNRNVVYVIDAKTKKPRECLLNAYAAQVMKLYITTMRKYYFSPQKKDVRLLFGGGESFVEWLNIHLNRESERLGLGRFSSHNFRHAVGYHLLKNGCPIRSIQTILGHIALRSTQIYTKVDKGDLRHIIDVYHPRRMRPTRDSEASGEKF